MRSGLINDILKIIVSFLSSLNDKAQPVPFFTVPYREYMSNSLITQYYSTGGNPSPIGKDTELFLKGIMIELRAKRYCRLGKIAILYPSRLIQTSRELDFSDPDLNSGWN